MPAPLVQALAARANVPISKVEATWEAAKRAAAKKFKRKDPSYWAYVNKLTQLRLGLRPVDEKVNFKALLVPLEYKYLKQPEVNSLNNPKEGRMRKSELENFDFDRAPRPRKKQKRHQRGFNEDALDARRERVNFKNYLRELNEQEVADLYEAPRPLTAALKEQLVADFYKWGGGVAPGESTDAQLRTFANTAVDADLDQAEVYEFLRNLANEKDQRC